MRDRQPLVPAPLRLPAALREYLREEAAGGIVLMAAAAVALAWANSPWSSAWRSSASWSSASCGAGAAPPAGDRRRRRHGGAGGAVRGPQRRRARRRRLGRAEATDIAFAPGVLALLGPRVPAALKVCSF